MDSAAVECMGVPHDSTNTCLPVTRDTDESCSICATATVDGGDTRTQATAPVPDYLIARLPDCPTA